MDPERSHERKKGPTGSSRTMSPGDFQERRWPTKKAKKEVKKEKIIYNREKRRRLLTADNRSVASDRVQLFAHRQKTHSHLRTFSSSCEWLIKTSVCVRCPSDWYCRMSAWATFCSCTSLSRTHTLGFTPRTLHDVLHSSNDGFSYK